MRGGPTTGRRRPAAPPRLRALPAGADHLAADRHRDRDLRADPGARPRGRRGRAAVHDRGHGARRHAGDGARRSSAPSRTATGWVVLTSLADPRTPNAPAPDAGGVRDAARAGLRGAGRRPGLTGQLGTPARRRAGAVVHTAVRVHRSVRAGLRARPGRGRRVAAHGRTHGPAGRPTALAYRVSLVDPGEIAAALPHLLGFRPRESVVLVSLAGRAAAGSG